MDDYVNNADLIVKPDFAAIALSWAEVGWLVFPCTEGGKTPLTKHGFKDASSDPKQIAEWAVKWPHANVGLVTDDVTVFDVEAPDVPRIPEFEAKYGQIPKTFTVQTWSGGRHYYLDGKVGRRTRPYEGFKIDVCGVGGYVMAPGSVVNGKLYEVITDTDFATMPAWLPKALASDVLHETSEARGEPVPLAHLQELVGRVDPDSDRDTWRDVIASARNTNCPEDPDGSTRLELVDAWSKRGSKYKGTDDVEAVWWSMPPREHGVGYGRLFYLAKAAGYDGPPAADDGDEAWAKFASVGEQPAKRDANPFNVRQEWEMYEVARLPEIFPGFMYQRGIGGIAAETQSFKTFHVTGMGMSVCTGEPYLGMAPILTGTVVYASLEDREAVEGPRRIAWREAHGIDRQRVLPFIAMNAPVLASNQEAEAFPEAVAEATKGKPPLRLIILETLARIGEGWDLNGLDMVRVTSFAERLARRFQCFVLLVHHKSDKAGAAEAMNSAYFKANLDVLYVVTRI